MMTPNTLSTNCGEWKRVAYYVYELSARQVSERPHGEALRKSLSSKSCLDLGNIASVAAYARHTHTHTHTHTQLTEQVYMPYAIQTTMSWFII